MALESQFSLFCDFCGRCIKEPQVAYKNDPMFLTLYGDHKVIPANLETGESQKFKCKYCLSKEEQKAESEK